ncbi:MAG: RNA polymerase sigma factor [Polyangiaceae bacterium]|nr:RNA polymerase sigma factor [Polyangiaceae bacterium]
MPRATALRPHLRLVDGAAASDGSTLGPVAALGDDQLVRLMKEGDPSAFETLYRRHAAFAINLAVRIQGNANDVEDVVHDAFLRAAQRTDSLRDPSAFRSWLGSIVVRLVKTRLRRAKLMSVFGIGSATQSEVVDLDLLVSSDAGPEARAELVQVYAMLLELPADDRIAWTLRYVEHHDLQGVSQLMDCSLATAKRRISRAQNHLLGTYGQRQRSDVALEPSPSPKWADEMSPESSTLDPSS